ncbi:hypothetical protein ACIQ4I_13540 [Rummeliibacillus sp. NPDC094406]|uniref:hypothetical protein n=1 Tax=Rummeliibacillus sp. NPDC094406 TaxID=3364511 RepID=UPI0038017C96
MKYPIGRWPLQKSLIEEKKPFVKPLVIELFKQGEVDGIRWRISIDAFTKDTYILYNLSNGKEYRLPKSFNDEEIHDITLKLTRTP